jgi:hypothetical protein
MMIKIKINSNNQIIQIFTNLKLLQLHIRV